MLFVYNCTRVSALALFIWEVLFPFLKDSFKIRTLKDVLRLKLCKYLLSLIGCVSSAGSYNIVRIMVLKSEDLNRITLARSGRGYSWVASYPCCLDGVVEFGASADTPAC